MTLARFFHAVLLGSTLLAVTPMRFGFTADAPPAQPAALAVNDISILFPMPKDAAGLAGTTDRRNARSTAGILANGMDGDAERLKLLDLISDPVRSRFFNTGCGSCNTETTLPAKEQASVALAGIAKDVLPSNAYNVGNFGWYPSDGATATRRTLREIEESPAIFTNLLSDN